MKLIIKTGNPYNWNDIIAKRMEGRGDNFTPTATQMVLNPTINIIGKFLGMKEKADWNKYCDKVFFIYKWAKEKAGTDNLDHLILTIEKKLNEASQMHDKRIDDLYFACKLDEITNHSAKQDFNGNIEEGSKMEG